MPLPEPSGQVVPAIGLATLRATYRETVRRLLMRSTLRSLFLCLAVALLAPATAGAAVVTEVVSGDGQFDGGVNDVVSRDGRYVAFAAGGQVRLRDTVADTTTLVSRAADGSPAGGTHPAISPDGRWVAFGGCAPTPDEDSHICLWDRDSGEVELVSRTSAGAPAVAQPWSASVSADGRYISFVSSDPALVPAANEWRSGSSCTTARPGGRRS
jgi:Tol biopolymer transport system component